MRSLRNSILIVIICILIPASAYAHYLDSRLMKAAKKGNVNHVQIYLNNGAPVNAFDKKWKTALMLASKKGHVEVVKLLLENGADVTATDKKGETALDKARKKKKKHIIPLLEFATVKKTNTIEKYDEFISQYPNSELIDTARLKIVEIHFKNANTNNTIQAYEQFIKKCPNSTFVKNAKLGIEKIKYDQTKVKNTIESYEQFINSYPNSGFVNDVNERIVTKHFDIAKAQDTIEVYVQFIDKYPDSELSNTARLKIENVHLNRAKGKNTIEAYEGFIKKYPNGKLAMQAQEFIEDFLIKDVIDNGIGNRFIIPDLLPDKNSHAGSIAIEEVGGEVVRLTTLYPKDQLRFGISQSGANSQIPLGNKAVLRFIGNVPWFRTGYKFGGDKVEPLTFMFLDNIGFVYLHGKGEVTMKDGSIITLPY